MAKYPRAKHAALITCELKPGDVLYMPSWTWHYVESDGEPSTSLDEHMLNVGVNLWFEGNQRYDALIISLLRFMRDASEGAAPGRWKRVLEAKERDQKEQVRLREIEEEKFHTGRRLGEDGTPYTKEQFMEYFFDKFGGAKEWGRAKPELNKELLSAMGLKNEGKDCWKACGERAGACSWCGSGLCCRIGYNDKASDCDGTIGIPGKGHVCSDASSKPRN